MSRPAIMTCGFQADGIWAWMSGPPRPRRPRPALFLDRDGVILDYVPYLNRAEDVRLVQGAGAAISAANQQRIPVVVVTNQSGIGRGYYGWPDLARVTARMEQLLGECGAHVDALFACPHHRDGRPPYNRDDHPGRKPNPGMLLHAAAALGLDLRSSWVVGDTVEDLMAGSAAGLAGGVHVLSGRGREQRPRVLLTPMLDFRLALAANLEDAAPLLLDSLAGSSHSGADKTYQQIGEVA